MFEWQQLHKLYREDHNNNKYWYKEKFKHVWKLTLKSLKYLNGAFHGNFDCYLSIGKRSHCCRIICSAACQLQYLAY